MALSSWYWKNDGYYLRLYESTGQGGNVEVQLPFEANVCEPVDLNDRRLETPQVTLERDRAR
jgi:hypothetical protein